MLLQTQMLCKAPYTCYIDVPWMVGRFARPCEIRCIPLLIFIILTEQSAVSLRLSKKVSPRNAVVA